MSKKITHITGVLLVAFLLPLFSFAQKVITGHVLSKNDQSPVPGVSVIIKGTHTGTSTGVDGGFALKAKEGDVLVISGVGIEKTEQEVNGSDLTIAVAADARELNQVVVTATGIKKEARRLGYALQTVDANTLTQAREADPVNALKGQAAGLEININPEIGRPAGVIMRGEGSPIFVVDGVPISSDTYNLNADDIENFTVLKGPNAAALYGFQGKDGAIIITTKKGSKAKGKPVITFNTSNQINTGFIALPKYQDTYGPGDNGKYAFGGGGSSAASYFGSGAVGVGINDYDYDVWGPQFRGQLLPQYDGAYTANQTYTTTFADGSKYTGHVAPTPFTARGKDNLKNFIQAGELTVNSISVSSSTEKTDMRLSFGDTWQRGIVPNTQLNNASFTANVTQRFSDKLSLSTYFNFSRQSTPNIPDVNYGPNSIIYNIIIWGGADWSVNSPNIRNYWQPGKAGIEQNYEEYYRYNNPWFMSYEWLRGHYQNNEYGYASLNYKLNQNFDFQFRPSFTAYDMFNSEKMPYSAGVYGRPLRQGDYREDRRQLFDNNEDLQARFHKNEIAGFLDLSAVAGATVRNFSFNSNFESTNYLNAPGVYAFSNSQGALTGSNFSSKMLVLSAYYSVDLGYKSYLTANVTGRVDKSSTLPVNNNSYYYPSFNLATVVSEYVHLPEVISFLKVRASYAESKDGGTNPTFTPNVSATPAGGYGYTWVSPYNGPSYQFSPSYNLTPTYTGQNSARYTDQVVSPNIHTADRKATEIGLDIRFLKNRIGLDVTRYRYWNQLIVNQGTSNASGYSVYETNGNVYTNNGWEATVSGKAIVNPHGLNWDVTANFFTFKREWVSNSNPDNYEKNGQRVDLVYGDAFVRTPAGKMVIDPSSGTYIRYSDLGSSAQKIFGHADPDWHWGLINTVSYKNFSMRFQFDGIVGGVITDYIRKKTLQGGRHIESATGALGAARPSDEANVPAYTGDGVNLTGGSIQLDPITGAITNYKSLTESTNTTKSLVQPFVYQASSINDLVTIKKTYVKLREVTLTYKVPQSTFGKKSIVSNASVSLVGRNLLYFFPSRYKDLDVDQYSQDSGSGLQTPTTRSYGININFSF
ncbi:SusC/RagA family TonB-linked outer membrane protein [Puia dinghuensis]|uniref:SusC/RagA family TonB-linked outer membrane protein n=1 Tax=Puia dinghuensis TaxID=1792502 RepID=A0A8J2UEY2_9BACT|nr:SusC/RagA family TonB-linked outer membrane protein [Puia dinghuensis]GGB07443.1 SusC/RagA family TonB-linked outer membrane protein [Puia dinghuensis]